MFLRDWQSTRTRQAWGTTASPIVLLLVCLIANIIALIVSIAINATVANEPDNDLGEGYVEGRKKPQSKCRGTDMDSTGWAIMMPAPCAALVWNVIDIAVCRLWVLSPVYTVSSSCILAAFYAAMSAMVGIFW